MSETTAFASALLGSVPQTMTSMLWTLQDKRSTWVPLGDGTDAVAQGAEALARAGNDVYVAVSVADAPGRPFTRISSDNSAGIMGLWADVDIADVDVHKKWNLPPDEAAAKDLLDRAGVPPSIVVHSGHGLQAWWLFQDFWLFDSESDRLAAADLSMRWNTTLRVRAAERDWTVDSTFDLARVMRVPGTVNRKGGAALPVRLLELSGQRYGRDDFDPFCVDDGVLRRMGVTPDRSYVVEGLRLHETAWPPGEKLDAMLEADPTFSASWNRKRRDLADQSGSSYDLSLASIAVMAGWTDQEIADLIIASRRKHRDDVSKGLRVDYVARTIARARDGQARDAAAESMEEVVEVLRHARREGDDEDVRSRRREAMDAIGRQLELEVVHFIKYTSEPPSYRMVTPAGGVDLGGASGILGWPQFRESVAAATSRMIPRFKQGTWDRIAQAIFDSCEEQDVGLESTESGQVQVWLSEYLMSKPPLDSVSEAAETEYPYRDTDGVHVFGSSLKRWLWLSRGERTSNRELGRMLRQYGCVPFKVNVTIGGERSSRAAWTVPGSHYAPHR